ncbi:MAG: GlsB/YeaQ/YmgE family stress response membrane protein [Candidatus Peribacteraceae bacterium]|nr:GlsB/YeaQ/YmgE family stress response membrane protein [Candidatus Peribacteraceae bacterium]
MNIVLFLIIGMLAGWIAGEIMKGSGFGLIGNLIVGVLGALVGGFIFDMLNIGTYGLIGSLITSVVGAVVLLFLLNAFRSTSHPTRRI